MHLRKIGSASDSLVILGGAGARASLLIPKARSFPSLRCYLAESQPPFEAESSARALMEALDAEQADRFHLLGVSLGGCTALAVASLFPARVKTLTLCAAFPTLSGDTRRHLETLKALRFSGEDEAFLALWKTLLYGDTPLPRGPFPLPEKETFCAQMEAALSFDHTRFSPPDCPTYVTFGKEDRLISPALTCRLGEYLGAEISAYPGGHLHFLTADLPDFF